MSLCPCGSQNEYDMCCGLYIDQGFFAPTAEKLMRSRYTAYTKAGMDYLKNTLHPDHQKEFDEENARKWSLDATWQGLEICETVDGGQDDSEGEVEFIARYSQNEEPIEHHERAIFEKIEGKWYFVDGKMVHATIRNETPKVKPNDKCPCGSGKKYKKCCGR